MSASKSFEEFWLTESGWCDSFKDPTGGRYSSEMALAEAAWNAALKSVEIANTSTNTGMAASEQAQILNDVKEIYRHIGARNYGQAEALASAVCSKLRHA